MRHSQLYIILTATALLTASASASLAGQTSPTHAAIPAAQIPDSITAADSMQASAADTDSAGVTASILNRRRISPDVTDDTTRRSSGPRISRVKSDLDNPVDINANDSMVIIGRNNAYIYGASSVSYGRQKIDADEIHLDMATSTVYAVGRPDSVGDIQGSPVFDDNGTSYEAKTMEYNFKSEKGIITDIITEQGEGYLTGGRAKKMDENTIFLQNGRYTTCNHHDNPHFYFQLTKAKVKPKKDIVVGPAYMVLAGLPLPLAVPFGYFPFSEKYSSGIIFPTFGDDYNRGFYLSDGGYYFAINDNIDLALTGEIY
ncbi:LPS-assembly protein LptD, partial [Paramuribaculum intestinale]